MYCTVKIWLRVDLMLSVLTTKKQNFLKLELNSGKEHSLGNLNASFLCPSGVSYSAWRPSVNCEPL